jgi:N-methylhydantoinase B
MSTINTSDFDPYMTAILANRVDGIVREMTHTLLRAARSAVINSARDFSCSICTADNQLLAAAEGLPIHIFGSHLQTKTMSEYHGTHLKEGDCYLHNDPYSGNTHPADHTFLVPVFVDGEHLFTTVAKAHQADVGNSAPTSYMAAARDVYEEGSLIFPAVRIQQNYEMEEDIVRMCRSRIRVPTQWYGDFLAGIGSARIGERRLKELCEKYGTVRIKAFVRDWLDYSERRMSQVIAKLPKASLKNSGTHDPFGDLLPEGIPLNVTVNIDPATMLIDIDLRDNIDNVECGFNVSEATVTSSTVAGVFNSIDPTVPRNSGSFRRVQVQLREGSVAGRPKFPHSCSVATTNVADRLINIVQSAFAQIGDDWGLAEGGIGMGAGFAVVSGKDPRAGNNEYVNQLIIASAGGPGSPSADGWPTYALPVIAGLMYRDSIEVDELKHPMLFKFLRVVGGTSGAGRFRGAPAMEVCYGPLNSSMEAYWPCDGTHYPAKGVAGGLDGCRAKHFKIAADGSEVELPNIVGEKLSSGEFVRGNHSSGGGYGSPLERDARRVLHDVLEGYETLSRARDIYGVVCEGRIEDDSLAIDLASTTKLRKSRMSGSSSLV